MIHRTKSFANQLAVIANDFQIPFHDEKALLFFKMFLRRERPDWLILNGDFQDFWEISNYDLTARTTIDGRVLLGIENFSMCSRRQSYVSHANCQLGFSVVYFRRDNGRFHWFPIPIGSDYQFVWRSREYSLEGMRRGHT